MVLPGNEPTPKTVHHSRYAIFCPDTTGEDTLLGDDVVFYGKMVIMKHGTPNGELMIAPGAKGFLCEWCAEHVRRVVAREMGLDE